MDDELISLSEAVSRWLQELTNAHEAAKLAGWRFLLTLRDGIEYLGHNKAAKTELYELASNATGLAIHTLQNYVSTANKPYTEIAVELGLEYQHVASVIGLPDEQAESVLRRAAELGWTPAQTSREAYPVPKLGNETSRCPTCGRPY